MLLWHRVMRAGGVVLLCVEFDPLPDWPLAFSFLVFCLLTPHPLQNDFPTVQCRGK